jgi:hypothetical protein
MGKLLLYNPWIHFYLFCLGGLIIALIWDSLHYWAAQHASGPARNHMGRRRTSPSLPSAGSKKPPQSEFRPRRSFAEWDFRPAQREGRELLNCSELEASCSAEYSVRFLRPIKRISKHFDDLPTAKPWEKGQEPMGD